jgi:RHS repeat-associated protein
LRTRKSGTAASGWIITGFRYYDQDAGRYLTRDPLGYKDGLNVYSSVHNNPINHFDPLGLEGEKRPNGWMIKTGTYESGMMSKADVIRTYAGPSRVSSMPAYAETHPNDPDQIIGWWMYTEQWHETRDVYGPDGKEFYVGGAYQLTDAVAYIRVPDPKPNADYEEALAFYQARVEQRERDIRTLAGNIGVAMDAFVHLMPGSTLLLDAPEAVTGKSMTTGQDLSGTQRGLSGAAVALGVLSIYGLYRAMAGGTVGTYTVDFQSGIKYHGKGDSERAVDSAKRVAKENGDVPGGVSFKPAANSREAFKEEARRIAKDGGPGVDNYNKINSPGKKYLEEDGK